MLVLPLEYCCRAPIESPKAWDAANAVLLKHRAALSHHHGIGMLRAPYMREGLGSAFPVLETVKRALDPKGILNPGKLGLTDVLPGEVSP